MKALDYSLYREVKEKFPALPGVMQFISLANNNLEDLSAVSFTEDAAIDFRRMIDEHIKDLVPYAIVGGFSDDDFTFYFSCAEFVQEEDYYTGKILLSEIGTYKPIVVDLEKVRKDLRSLFSSTILSGNA